MFLRLRGTLLGENVPQNQRFVTSEFEWMGVSDLVGAYCAPCAHPFMNSRH